MQIVRCKPDDAALLTRIAFAAKRHWGYPEEWMEAWRTHLTLAAATIAAQETHAAWVSKSPVGFYSLRRATDNSMSLEHLWVLPEAMGRGIGKALFLHAAERAKVLGCERLEIESDPNAAGCYERMGARRFRVAVAEVEGQARELPVLVYEMDESSTPSMVVFSDICETAHRHRVAPGCDDTMRPRQGGRVLCLISSARRRKIVPP